REQEVIRDGAGEEQPTVPGEAPGDGRREVEATLERLHSGAPEDLIDASGATSSALDEVLAHHASADLEQVEKGGDREEHLAHVLDELERVLRPVEEERVLDVFLGGPGLFDDAVVGGRAVGEDRLDHVADV